MKENLDFCPNNCPNLNLTEEQQNMLDEPKLHFCTKYKVRLYHRLAHPNLYKCEQCFKES